MWFFTSKDTKEVSDRFVAHCFVNGLEAYDGEINLGVEKNMISNEYAVKLCLEHEVKRGNKVVKKELIVALRGEIYFVKFIINPEEDDVEPGLVKEEEEAVKRIKGEALKEKGDPGAFIFPIKLEGHVNENALAYTRSDINTMPYWIYEQLGREEMNKTMGTHDDEAGSSRSKRSRQHETVEVVLLLQIHHEFLLWEGCNRDAKSRYNTKLAQFLPRHIYSPCVVNWDVLNQMGCDGEIDDMLRIRLREAGKNEEILTPVAWIRAFNINEPIYAELCDKFYSTYEFDEVCADDELQTKKIIKFRLGRRAHSLTLLEFARRLGLYHAVELDEEGFNVYFEGGLEYWLSISREENLGYDKIQKNDMWLLSMFDARHQNRYVNVDWVIARWMKRKRAGTKKESQICCGQFISKIARKCKVLTEEVVRSLSALIYCRDLDTITLRDLIDSDGKLILEDPQPGVPRVGIPRPPRASMQDLYDRMDRMEIYQEAIERMKYRQSYH
ncbi:hypothetical protein Tco_0299059 [Tanacetum coccineum]